MGLLLRPASWAASEKTCAISSMSEVAIPRAWADRSMNTEAAEDLLHRTMLQGVADNVGVPVEKRPVKHAPAPRTWCDSREIWSPCRFVPSECPECVRRTSGTSNTECVSRHLVSRPRPP